MIRRTIKLLWRGAVIGFLAYAFFFTRLGNRTPFQHVVRIVNTQEAQELGHEMGVATERISKHIGDQVYDATQPPELDATGEEPEKVADQIHDIKGHSYQHERLIDEARDDGR